MVCTVQKGSSNSSMNAWSGGQKEQPTQYTTFDLYSILYHTAFTHQSTYFNHKGLLGTPEEERILPAPKPLYLAYVKCL